VNVMHFLKLFVFLMYINKFSDVLLLYDSMIFCGIVDFIVNMHVQTNYKFAYNKLI